MNIKIIESTPFGSVALIWSLLDDSPKILQILMPKLHLSLGEQLSQIYPHSTISSTKEVDNLAQDIKAFFQGEDIKFSLDLLNIEQCSEFQRKVLMADYGIPRGRVSTYQLLAEQVGRKKGARAVGNAMANNPFPIIIPCHRVISSNGTIGGFQGGTDMKRALLENEGIKFDGRGRVCSPFYYEPKKDLQLI